MEYLELDLNGLVNKQIEERLNELSSQVKKYTDLYIKEKERADTADLSLKRYEKDNESVALIFNSLRTAFVMIDSTPETEKSYKKSKQENQYKFIENVLSSLFGIKRELNGWYDDGNLATHLAINFYHNKPIITAVVKLFIDGSDKIVSFINDFKMPYDYTRQEVIDFVKNPQYNTNGHMFEVSRYWVEYGAGKKNMPHSLIMKSPFIIEEDVFNEVINTIQSKKSNYYYLYALPKYAKLSEIQIKKLGETLLIIGERERDYSEPSSFIEKNLTKFNNKTLDFFYQFITDTNQYKTLHWENFPYEYQCRYLMSKTFAEVNKIVNNYSCKWTEEEKEKFFKRYLTNEG